MAKDQVEEVKEKIDILEIVGERVTLKRAGRHYKGLCPFHSEKSPSFIVSPERQSYKCFGCGEGGDVFSFLQKYEGMSFLESLESLAKRVGVEIVSYRATEADSYKKTILTVLSLASEYYHYLLTKHETGEHARKYLKDRGIINDSIKQFYLGYAPLQWRGVSEFLVNKKGYGVQDLEAAGLVIVRADGQYYDRFRGRVIFPLRDHRGQVVGFSGRVLVSDEKQAKYINSPETSVYHKSSMLYGLYENRESVRKSDAVIIVEGELDVIPSVQAGVKNVVAIKGSAFTNEMGRLVSRYTKNVVYALDADSAGQEAVKRAVVVAEPLDLSIRVVQISGGKDPGDVASADPSKWREMVKSAVLYWDFLIDSACSRSDPKSGEGASQISAEVVPELTNINNLVVRAHYVGVLSKRLSIPEESIYEEIERIKKKKDLFGLKEVVKKIEQGEHQDRKEQVQDYVLALLLQNYLTLKDSLSEMESAWFTGSSKKIVEAVLGYRDTFEIKKLAATLPSELLPTLDAAYLRDLSGIADIHKEWSNSLTELEEEYIRERLKVITGTIAREEGEGGGRKLEELQREFAVLGKRLSKLQ